MNQEIFVKPVWAQMSVIKVLYGVSDNRVRQLVNEGRVRAKKENPDQPGSTTIFRCQDVEDYINEEMPDAPRFKVPAFNMDITGVQA
jgi:hypothetical protein